MDGDNELLRGYAEDCSEVAFTALVQRYLSLVYSAALRRVGNNAHLAADVTQTVFIALARNAASLSRHRVLSGWLYITTRNAAIDALRIEQRRHAREQEAHIMHELTSISNAKWEEIRPFLDSVMDELTDRDREAVLLRYFEGLRFAEIGATLNLTEDAVRMRVDRALEKLHRLLSRRGITSTTAALTMVLANQAVTAAPAGLAEIVTGTALASMSTAAGPAINLLQFMSTSKITAGFATAILVLAVGLSMHEVQAERETRASLTAANQELSALLDKQQQLEQQAQIGEQDLTELQTAVDRMRTAQVAKQGRAIRNAAQAQANKPVTPTPEQVAAGQAFLKRHPDVKLALVDRSRARVDSRYRSLYRALSLTPTQIEQFENLLMEGEGVNMENPETNEQLILRPGTGLSRAEVESHLHDLLGATGFQQYQEITGQIPGRQVALQVAGALYFTDTPLTASQADQLTQIVTESRAETRAMQANNSDYWNTVMTRAQGILSEPQLTVLTGLQQKEQYQQAVSQLTKGWTLPGWGPNTKAQPAH